MSEHRPGDLEGLRERLGQKRQAAAGCVVVDASLGLRRRRRQAHASGIQVPLRPHRLGQRPGRGTALYVSLWDMANLEDEGRLTVEPVVHALQEMREETLLKVHAVVG